MHAQFVIRQHHKATRPLRDIGRSEHRLDMCRQSKTASRTQPHQQQAVMCPGSKPADVREIQILSDEESSIRLRRCPYVFVWPASDTFLANIVRIVSHHGQDFDKRLRQILVKFDLHATAGRAGTGRSSSAEAAAKAITARKAAAVTVG